MNKFCFLSGEKFLEQGMKYCLREDFKSERVFVFFEANRRLPLIRG